MIRRSENGMPWARREYQKPQGPEAETLREGDYDISFHNEIWASTFFGNFAAGTTWQKERVFWWGGTQPPTETFVQNPIGHIHTKVLGDTNTLNPNGMPVKVQNRTLYHNFKPLSSFLTNPNLQAYALFNGAFSPHSVYDDSTKIEAYYLTNVDSTFAIGWVHNLNAYWENHYYVKNDPTMQNFLGCASPDSPQSISLPGFYHAHDYHITWFPTRIGGTVLPAGITTTNSAGEVTLDLSVDPLNGVANNYLDTLHSDYAFIITIGPPLRSEEIPNETDTLGGWDFGLFPNPADDVLNLLLPDDAPTGITIYDLSGRPIRVWSSLTGPSLRLPIKQLARGVYYVKVSNGVRFKVKKLIIQ